MTETNGQLNCLRCGHCCMTLFLALANILADADDVREKCSGEREFITARQVETLQDYFDRWIKNPGTWAK